MNSGKTIKSIINGKLHLLYGAVTLLVLVGLAACYNRSNITCLCPDKTENYFSLNEIPTYSELGTAFSCAKECNKPVLIEFTGWNISNRKTSDLLFGDTKTAKIVSKEFISVELYLDDRTKLPPEEHRTYYLRGKRRIVKTIGQKNSKYLLEKFNIVASPFYVILEPDGTTIIDQFGYTPREKDLKDRIIAALNSRKN